MSWPKSRYAFSIRSEASALRPDRTQAVRGTGGLDGVVDRERVGRGHVELVAELAEIGDPGQEQPHPGELDPPGAAEAERLVSTGRCR